MHFHGFGWNTIPCLTTVVLRYFRSAVFGSELDARHETGARCLTKQGEKSIFREPMRVSMRTVPILIMLLSTVGILSSRAFGADTIHRGFSLENPEFISGFWESHQFDRVVGLHIGLVTTVAGAPSSLVGVKQVVKLAEIQVYQRDGPKRVRGDGNWFVDDSPGVQWTGRQIIIERPANAAIPAIRLNLIFYPEHSSWKGRSRRGTFDHTVTLVRPHPKAGITKSPFVGTWYRPTLMNNCLHIVQTGEGALSGWSDDLVTPGRIRYANGIKRPTETVEEYGSIALVQIASPTTLFLELKAFSAVCCSITSGLQLPSGVGAAKHSEVGVQRPEEWSRVEGTSCVKDAASSN